nr:hypothetical protein [Tanacetum cinerariifolium]
MGVFVSGKSVSAVQRLLVGAVQNAEVRGEVALTLPFVISSVSATPKHECGDHTGAAVRADLRTFGPPPRFLISSDSSHRSGANVAEAEVDSFVRPSALVVAAAVATTSTADPAIVVKGKTVKPSMFSADSASTGGTDPAMGGFTDLSGSEFLVGCIRTVISPDTDIQKVWSVTNGIEHDHLFTEFNVGAARQMSLSAKVRMRAAYNIRERRRIKSVVEEKDTLLTARDEEIRSLKAQLLLKEAQAAEAILLRVEASNFEAVEKSL